MVRARGRGGGYVGSRPVPVGAACKGNGVVVRGGGRAACEKGNETRARALAWVFETHTRPRACVRVRDTEVRHGPLLHAATALPSSA